VVAPADGAEAIFTDEASNAGIHLVGGDYARVAAAQVEFARFTLEDVDLSGSRLDQLQLHDGEIIRSDLANLKSDHLFARRVEFRGCRLTGAALSEPRLSDILFNDCRMDLASFRFGKLTRVRFEGCRLSEVDFQGVAASACTFINCDLTRAQLSQGSFKGSAFRDCQLSGVRGIGALKGAAIAANDLLELADSFAATLGISVRDDIE
jgi:uncharacterized protein YjbI with pentapeptide repeats